MKSYVINGVRYYPRDDVGYRQRGYASWYGPKFHGRQTANGERYNQYALTAAHKTLPLGSYIKVTNLKNGRAVTLLVNDRGPFVRGRIVDVSKRGAQILDMIGSGTAPVIVERTDRYGRPLVGKARVQPVQQQPVQPPPPTRQVVPQTPVVTASTQPAAPAFSPAIQPAGPVLVQVGSFSDFYNAQRLQQSLTDVGPSSIMQVTLAQGDVRYRVQIGPYADPIAAQQALAQVKARGHAGATLQGHQAGKDNSR
ncbi:MAG: septal ring lytic transglycosylase RlpA family protein [Pseudomonadota bacterium]